MKQHSSPGITIKAQPHWRVGIVAATFYKEEIDALVESAKKFLLSSGIQESNISVHYVAGSFEVPLIGSALAEAKAADALIGIGIIVQGETAHADLLAAESARGIMDVQVRTRIPFAFEILWVKNLDQVRARFDKGAEAANAVLQSLAELERIHS